MSKMNGHARAVHAEALSNVAGLRRAGGLPDTIRAVLRAIRAYRLTRNHPTL
jgi:hypothetical protein